MPYQMKDWSETVHLPKTDFPMKADLPKREPEILDRWRKMDLYRKMLARRKDRPSFLLHDGPPYANGPVHMGTALNRVLKDIVIKYKAMAGYETPFVPGWDCHGLPIEHQLLKEMGKDKTQVDRLQLRKQAERFARHWMEEQRKDFIRLGCTADWERPYLTMQPDYEAGQIRALRKLVEGGYLYRGRKPVYWCAECRTALAEAEVEYAEKESDSLYLLFPSLPPEAPGDFMLVWTTTPWTLPANVALAFHPAQEYVGYRCREAGAWKDRVIWFAEKRREAVCRILGKGEMVGKEKGAFFENKRFLNPLMQRPSRGVLAEFVSMEEGTGIVHIAPGHGVEDFEVGRKYRLEVVSPVDDTGRFDAEGVAHPSHTWKGKKVWQANGEILRWLKEKGRIVQADKIRHSYPHCWRCKKPVIFRATPQWFLSVEHQGLRKRMLEQIKRVTWHPPSGANRIAAMVEQRPDWCLSRQRYWGVPIPVLYCEKCGQPLGPEPWLRLLEKVEEVFRKLGSDAWYEKPVEFWAEGFSCGCGGTRFRKEEDILDVWFDSGTSFEAVLNRRPELAAGAKPPEKVLYLEGSDQHRGWFQTSLIPSVAIYGKAPYDEVVTHGYVVDSEGRKMSKSLGNVMAPQEVMEKHGAEIVRLWAASEDCFEDVRISGEILKRLVDAYRKIRNTIRFLLGNLRDFRPEQAIPAAQKEKMPDLDRWMMSRLQEWIGEVRQSYEAYQFHRVTKAIHEFCVNDLSGFYLDCLKDRLYICRPDSPERRSAQTVLQALLRSILLYGAPILSFTCEEAWGYAGFPQESPFLADLPEPDPAWRDSDLEEEFQRLRQARDAVLLELEKARRAGKIRASLEAAIVVKGSGEVFAAVEKDPERFREACIVSSVETVRGNGLSVEATRASGEKCARCWRYFPELSDGICARCRRHL